MKQSMQEAGYKFIRKDDKTGEYLLLDIRKKPGTRNLEWWFANKDHASYGIKFRGTHLEFARSADKNEAPF